MSSQYRYYYRFVVVKPTGFYFNSEALAGEVGSFYVDSIKSSLVLKPVTAFNEDGRADVVLTGVPTFTTKGLLFNGEPRVYFYEIPCGAVPPGTILMYGGKYEPPGWFFCNGKSISKTVYSDLFNVIGYTYTNNTVKTYSSLFTVPDLRYKVVKMFDNVNESANYGILNSTGGYYQHKLTSDELPNHTHDGNLPLHGASHTHTYEKGKESGQNFTNAIQVLNPYGPPSYPARKFCYRYFGGDTTGKATFNATINAGHTHPISTLTSKVYQTNNSSPAAISANVPFYICQPSLYVSFIIRT
jgi:microcystin-dependent protein